MERRSDTQFSCQEASLVRLALNAMQGVESAIFSVEKLYASFCSDRADRSYHQIPNLWNRSSSTLAIGKILNSIGCLGSLVFLLHKFVDFFMGLNLDSHSLGKKHVNSNSESNQSHCEGSMQKEEYPPYSLVNQAFAVAVGKVLEGYIHALNTLYASVGLRRSLKSADEPFDASNGVACFTSVMHSEFTLLEVYLHTKELTTQIEALGSICNLHNIDHCFSVSSFEELTAKVTSEFSKFYIGGDLLSYLYKQLQVADPAHRALLKFLFLRSCEPYCGFIRSWIFKAEISDPYKEFVVENVDDLPSHQHCKAGIPIDYPLASIRDRVAVPCFLQDSLVPFVRAGQQLQVLKKLLELCNFVGPGDYKYDDFLPSWNGYLSNHLFCASPMTFSKGCLQAMTIARNRYYQKMQEKLENLLTKLEFRHQKVLPHGAVPIFFRSGGESSELSVSFTWDHRAADDMDSDYSSIKDEFHGLDTSESSECSSLSSSEEQMEAEQLIEHPNGLVGHEKRYLSALRISMSNPSDNNLEKPSQGEQLHVTQGDFYGEFETVGVLGHSVDFHHKKTTFSPMFVPLGLKESHALDIRHKDTSKCWPYSNNPFCNFALEVSKTNSGFLKEGRPYLDNITSTKHTLVKEDLEEVQIDNGTPTSNLFKLQPCKMDCNFLSRNPILRKNVWMSESGEKCRTYGQSLPCFNFSAVEDPCKAYVEKLAASLRRGLGSQVLSYVSAPGSSTESHENDRQGSGGHDVLIDSARASGINSSLDLKEHKQAVSTNACGGRRWESVLGSFICMENESLGDYGETSSAMFEIPLDFIIDKCLLQEILLQYKYVSKLAIKLLEEGFDLQGHLLALRRYYFMESADWADLFIMSLWHQKKCVTEADQRVSEIQGFLELSVQRSSCERDPYKDRLFVYIKGNGRMPLSTSAIGVHSFEFLGLGYRADWPVSIILTPSSLKIYSEIFSFLIKVKLAVFSLTDVWCLLKDLIPSIGQDRNSAVHKQELGRFNMLIKMRQQINHFVSALQQYVQSQLSHVSWFRLLHSLKYKVKDMMDLESVHMAYLTDSLQICFLSDETRSVASFIENILQCALEFRSCLSGSMWDVGLAQGGLPGNLSGINISQVLTIKQKFDNNLKELHLCYLTSPKHRAFGVTCFWEYLNYNEYYSDLHSQMQIHAF